MNLIFNYIIHQFAYAINLQMTGLIHCGKMSYSLMFKNILCNLFIDLLLSTDNNGKLVPDTLPLVQTEGSLTIGGTDICSRFFGIEMRVV